MAYISSCFSLFCFFFLWKDWNKPQISFLQLCWCGFQPNPTHLLVASQTAESEEDRGCGGTNNRWEKINHVWRLAEHIPKSWSHQSSSHYIEDSNHALCYFWLGWRRYDIQIMNLGGVPSVPFPFLVCQQHSRESLPWSQIKWKTPVQMWTYGCIIFNNPSALGKLFKMVTIGLWLLRMGMAIERLDPQEFQPLCWQPLRVDWGNEYIS